ncbi:isoleucine--tRNA ligase [Flavobacteriaceae bacterium F08102]|nr:isoleucine--tRNA ligase [Flavobacteriaceae bacterium F08102]
MSDKFKEYKGLDLSKTADEILAFWEQNDIFQKSIDSRDENKPFVFYEGPPSANGLPGIHHVMARSIKDIFCRFKTQQGFQVKRKAGWDTHGLPIELGVEKELGITKEDIGTKISVEAYNEACKKAVMRYTDVWEALTKKMGHWVDMNNPYITYTPKYMESVWWLLKQIYEKNLLYKGYSIQPYSPKAGTGLSSHELNQPGTYQDVTDTTVVAQFKVNDPSALATIFNTSIEGDAYMLAWTTTPWTLPSNTALTVGPKIDYVLVKTFNQYTFKATHVVVAKSLLSKQFDSKYFAAESEDDFKDYIPDHKKIPFKVLGECKGVDLVGVTYEQLLPYALPYQHAENAFRVISGDFVTTEDGTGIVHTAPTFGADDAMVAKQATPEIPPMLVLDENNNPVPLVDLQGRFRPEMGELAGKYVKNEYYDDGEAPERSVDVELAIKLKEENKAFKVEKYKHSYPNCWRTDKPILYYPLDSWFIKVSEKRDRMYELNQRINWKPASTGEGRFGNWLKNANDWNLSRSRYWGIPLPIWRTEDGKEEQIIGSVEELKEGMKAAVKAGFMKEEIFPDFEVGNMSDENYAKIDLHKNIVDQIVLVSPSGKPMYRESDLIDVWFDSGSMPYAQWHYPFEHKELIDEGKFFPADFIAEGVDQTRGWFYTQHAIGTLVFDSNAYKNVVSNGLVLDKNGKKMSKRLGNAVDPFKTMSTYGADATRWYMISNANPWDNLKFDIDGIEEVRRKFFGTLYNTYSFFALYANIDQFSFKEKNLTSEDKPEIDRWIISELHSLIKEVTAFYEDYEPTKAARAIQNFVTENLSNWFVRLSRRRFWKGEYAQDKISAYQTLYSCLLNVAKMAAPIAPFYMDQLYRDLNGVTKLEPMESVHLSDFPVADLSLIDPDLERKMEKAQTISSMVLSLRKKEMIKVRQPLRRIMIPVLDQQERLDIEAVADLIISEVNVKQIELIDDASDMIVKQIKPNFKTLGPKYGKEMRFVVEEIKKMDKTAISKIEKEGEMEVEINGKKCILTLSDVEIISQDIEGWLVANQGNLTVALDVSISESLKREGIARELVNRIQNFRKEAGFEITDKICIFVERDGIVDDAILDNQEYIKNETLTAKLELHDRVNDGVEVAFDDVHTKLLIEKV